ncbi:hypothetical protein GCM10026982_54760 [Nocardiopsis aegyptia]
MTRSPRERYWDVCSGDWVWARTRLLRSGGHGRPREEVLDSLMIEIKLEDRGPSPTYGEGVSPRGLRNGSWSGSGRASVTALGSQVRRQEWRRANECGHP